MRLPLIGRWLKAAPQRNPGDAPQSPAGYSISRGKRPLVSASNVLAAHRALEHPIVFRCLNKIATSVQQVRWFAEPDPDVNLTERASATAIKAINAALTSPTDTMTADQLRFWFALSYAVYGRAPFKVGIGVNNFVNGIYPLDAAHTKAILNNRGVIQSYEYGEASNKESLPSKTKAGPGKSFASEIAVPALNGSRDSGKNINALGAIGLPAEVADLLLRRAYDTASGHPNSKYIVTAEKTLTERQKDAIREHIEGAAVDGDESGSVLFLYNTAVEVHKLDNDLNNIHSKMPLDDMSRMIAGAFGIPISLLGLGAADGAKFAGNYIESRQSFWEDTIIPCYCTPIASGLTQALCPYGARIVFDLDSIDAVQDSRATRSQKLSAVDFLTDDEKREVVGYAPLTAEQKAEIAARRPKAVAPGTSGDASA